MDDKKRQLGDLSVYRYYFNTVGIRSTLIFFGISMIYGFLYAFPAVWLKWWADANDAHSNQQTTKYLSVYAVFQVGTTVALTGVCWYTFQSLAVKSGLKLHLITLTTITSAPMSLFSAVDTGVLLNRFSQDIGMIDSELPMADLNLATGEYTIDFYTVKVNRLMRPRDIFLHWTSYLDCIVNSICRNRISLRWISILFGSEILLTDLSAVAIHGLGS